MHKGRLQPDQIPRHVAIIMDGNGRWAESRGKTRLEGHRQGLLRVRDVVRAANELSIQYLTLYAFSLENWNRPRLEVDGLMSLLMDYLETDLDEVDRNGIQLRTIGHKERLNIRDIRSGNNRTKAPSPTPSVRGLSWTRPLRPWAKSRPRPARSAISSA